MKNKMRALVWLALMLTGLAGGAWADCASPAGKEGEQVYASSQKTMVFCNGTDWMAMGSATSGGGVSGNIAVSNISVTTNVSISGVTSVGWERVTGSTGASSTASCSAGKQVMGGGCTSTAFDGNWGTGGYYCSAAPGGNAIFVAPHNYPSSNSAWNCSCPSGTTANSTVTAYAICARLN